MIQDFINQLEKKEDLDFHSMQSDDVVGRAAVTKVMEEWIDIQS